MSCPSRAQEAGQYQAKTLIGAISQQRIYEAEEERILLPFTAGAESVEVPEEGDSAVGS